MAQNIANLVNQETGQTLVDNVPSQFIVTPLTPSTIGVSGYVFNIIGNEEFVIDSDITDSFSETNVSYQDQIALRPEQFTLSGYVGELVNSFPNQFTDIITALAPFGIIPGLGVTFNTQDEQFYDELALVTASENSLVNTAASVYGLFSALSTTATMQQHAFQYFYNLWLSRTLCTVETPWGILQSMAILSMRARQDETTRLVSDFSITFKAMRFASASIGTPTSPTTSTSTASAASQAAIPVPSIVGSDQANAILQSTPDNVSGTGPNFSNVSLTQSMTGLS